MTVTTVLLVLGALTALTLVFNYGASIVSGNHEDPDRDVGQ